MAQGFLFAKPMPAAAFVGFVNQWRDTTMTGNEPSTACCVCCKEIPLDAAFTPEGAEYVEHFCGLECYQRFQREPRARPNPAPTRTLAIRRRQVEGLRAI